MGSVRYSTLTVEILCQAAGTDDLASVRHLQLMVDSTDQPATLIGEELPNLVSLDLSGSVLSSLRDLGTGLSRLEVLNVSHCGLCDLEGLSSFPALRELYAPNNTVSDLSPVGMSSSSTLAVVDLANNDIKDEYALMQLGSCEASLRSLTLEGNPFSTAHLSAPDGEEAYRATVMSYLPALHRLDGRALPGAPSSPSASAFESANAASGPSGSSSSLLAGGGPGGGSSFLESTSMVRPSSALGGLGGSDAGGGGSVTAPLAGGLAAASFRRRRLGSTQSTGGGGGGGLEGGGSLTAARDTLHSAGSLSLGADSFDAVPSPLARGASAGGRPRSSAAFRPGSASAQGSWVGGGTEGWDDDTLGSGAAVPVFTTGAASGSSSGANFLSRLASRSESFGGAGSGTSSSSGGILAVLEAGKAEDARVRRENAAATAKMVAETKAAAAAAEVAAAAAAAAKLPSPAKAPVAAPAPAPVAAPAPAPVAAPAPGPTSSASPSSHPVCPAAALSNERLVAMLRERPKNVPELHSREAFRRFFAGFSRARMLSLLAEAYGGLYPAEEAAERALKRQALVDDLLL